MNSKKNGSTSLTKGARKTKSDVKVVAKSRTSTPADAAVKSTPKRKPAAPRARRTPAETKNSSKPITKILAQVNVGFGNSLYIRGDAAGLSWETGVPLSCVGDSLWSWQTDGVADTLTFKLLLNDEVWCQGADFRVSAGEEVDTNPAF